MSKLINISDKTYAKLKSLKGEDKSFTIVIENLLEKKEESNKEAILALAGKGSFDEEKLKDLKKGWKKWTEKYA